MIIKIDCREKALLEECNKQQLINDSSSQFIKIISENIPLGDIIIYDDNNTEKLIIERKTLLDLAASIRDGRYTEQGFRLQQCSMHNHNIIYLIEGDLRYYKPFKSTIDKKALLSSMVSINYFKGFSLFRTITLTETAEWLLQLTRKLHKESALTAYYDKALLTISISDKSGKLRKINKTCILNIYKYLLGEKNKQEVEVISNENAISLE